MSSLKNEQMIWINSYIIYIKRSDDIKLLMPGSKLNIKNYNSQGKDNQIF